MEKRFLGTVLNWQVKSIAVPVDRILAVELVDRMMVLVLPEKDAIMMNSEIKDE